MTERKRQKEREREREQIIAIINNHNHQRKNVWERTGTDVTPPMIPAENVFVVELYWKECAMKLLKELMTTEVSRSCEKMTIGPASMPPTAASLPHRPDHCQGEEEMEGR